MHRRVAKFPAGWVRRLPVIIATAWLTVGVVTAWGDVPYRTEIRGDFSSGMARKLRDLSELVRLERRVPASLFQLRQRADRDVENLADFLKRDGYYDGSVSYEVVTPADAVPAVIQLRVHTGTRYRVGSILVDSGSIPADDLPEIPPRLGRPLKRDAPATFDAILNGEQYWLRRFREGGYAWAKATDRRVVVTPESNAVQVVYRIEPGPLCVFGETRLPGGDTAVPVDVIRRELPWREGEPFRESVLEAGRQRLTRLGLFSTVRMEPDPAAAGQPAAPILVSVSPRPPRAVALGLKYYTDIGISGEASWEHRNFRGEGERLEVSAKASPIRQELSGSYRLPGIPWDRQRLILRGQIVGEQPDAYESVAGELGARVEGDLSPDITAGIGPTLRLGKVKQNLGTTETVLLGLPGGITLDRRNDRLDATRGLLLQWDQAPYAGLDQDRLHLWKTELQVAGYQPLSEGDEWVLAGRLRAGALVGEAFESVPADLKFYAGGGGSVRGYKYQMAGPLDRDEDPTGGRSLLETSVELRRRLTEKLGLVTFLDSGTVFRQGWPDFSEPLRVGAGIGIRYATPLGPLRVDVATPINRRDGVDPAVQVYFGFGQAF